MPPPAALRWLATAILLIPPAPLAGQLAGRGDRIRIRDGADSRWIRGTVTTATADSFLISTEFGQRWAAWRNLSGLHLSRGRAAINTGMIGAAVGVGVGFGLGIYDTARRDCIELDCLAKVFSYLVLPPLGALGGGILGFGVGTLIGTVAPRERWTTLVVVPGDGTVRMGLSVALREGRGQPGSRAGPPLQSLDGR